MQTNISAENTRFRWVDLIRALGAFLVVLAHVEYLGAGPTIIRDLYYAITRVAVPLFFMASGYLLLSKQESYADFFRKRAVKVFIPFLIWSVVYLLWNKEGFDQPLLTVIKSYILKIIRGPRESHLWFFYELFGLYLFTPVLRVYLQKAAKKDLYYFLGAWFFLMIVAKAVQEFTPVQIGFTYYFLGGYIGYFLFGYVAGNLELNDHQRHIAWIVFLEGLVFTVAGMSLSGYYEIKNQYFEDYLSINVVIMSCALFVALIGKPVLDTAYRLVLPLSRASFGIYLAHVIIMALLFSLPASPEPLKLMTTTGLNIYMIPLIGLLGFIATFALIFILQKIPILKKIVP